jgi:hypothetical protein
MNENLPLLKSSFIGALLREKKRFFFLGAKQTKQIPGNLERILGLRPLEFLLGLLGRYRL